MCWTRGVGRFSGRPFLSLFAALLAWDQFLGYSYEIQTVFSCKSTAGLSAATADRSAGVACTDQLRAFLLLYFTVR